MSRRVSNDTLFHFTTKAQKKADAEMAPWQPHLIPLDPPGRHAEFTRERCSNCLEVWVGYSHNVHCTCGCKYEGGKFVGKVGAA